jgi:hypothetical protein
MRYLLRTVCPIVALLSVANFGMHAASRAVESKDHAYQLGARITLRRGTTRTVTLQGVGCSQSICSRTAIKGRDGHELVREWLDSLAEIKDTTHDQATFVSKNGGAQRLSLVKDFRVLYVETENGTEKVHLESVRSVEFLNAQR